MYNQIKNVFGREKYIDSVKDFRLRQELSKFRLSCHNLQIEKGRKLKIEQSLRFCDLCKNDQIGDEKHLVLYCIDPNIVKFRYEMNVKINSMNFQFKLLPEACKFIYLFSCSDQSTINIFAIFLIKCFKYLNDNSNV